MYYATHSQVSAVSIPTIQPRIDTDGRDFAKSMVMLLIALLILVAITSLSITVMASIQYSHGIAEASASLADPIAVKVAEPRTPDYPADIPLFKGGSVAASGYDEGLTYEIIFPLGSIAQVQAFYQGEMIKSGWSEYASGTYIDAFYRDGGQRTASLYYRYYGGNVLLRVLTSE